MTEIIYIDSINGNDQKGRGDEGKPFKTLEYFCNTIASKTNADYEVRLESGTYEIKTSTIFGQFSSGFISIVGSGESTEIIQNVGMFTNTTGGGSQNFTLEIAKCKYNISNSLLGANLICNKWKWNFYNVLFEHIPNNAYGIFCSYANVIFKNCVKLENTTAFLRKNSITISVQDSIGYFTSGYQTTQSDWDKGGNTIGSTQGYETFLNSGSYSWSKAIWFRKKLLLKSNNKIYSIKPKEVSKEINMTSNTTPSPYVVSASHESSLAWNAFSSNSSYWYANSTAPSGGHWIQIKLDKKLRFSLVELKTQPVSGNSYGIKNFKILGSLDGVIFEELFSGIHGNDNSNYTYEFENNKEYLYYRVQGNSYHTDSHMLITNLVFFEAELDVSEVPSLTRGNLDSYGVFGINGFTSLSKAKNYILQDTVSENADGLWVQEIDRKPLSIKFE